MGNYYEFSTVGNECIEAISELASIVFQDDFLTPERWRYKYLKWGDSPPPMALLWDGNKLIAYYAIQPLPMICHGREIRAGQSTDTMVHPDYRRKGLFTESARYCYYQAKKLGYEFLYGRPNNQSVEGFRKMGCWNFISEAEHLEIEKEPNRIEGRYHGLLPITSWMLSIKKDWDYLKWRYLDHWRDYIVHVEGSKYFVLKKYFYDEFHIMDIGGLKASDDWCEWIRVALVMAEKLGASKVSTMVTGELKQLFLDMGFVSRKIDRWLMVQELTLLGVQFPSDFATTMGDYDMY